MKDLNEQVYRRPRMDVDWKRILIGLSTTAGLVLVCCMFLGIHAYSQNYVKEHPQPTRAPTPTSSPVIQGNIFTDEHGDSYLISRITNMGTNWDMGECYYFMYDDGSQYAEYVRIKESEYTELLKNWKDKNGGEDESRDTTR